MTTMNRQTVRARGNDGATARALGIAAVAVLAASCQEARPERSYVQTNVIRKDVFEGEWYYSRTVVDNSYESAMFTFRGDMTFSYELGTMERIRWIIDEQNLYAVRTYELIAGGNNGGGNPQFLGEPVAAFPIAKHFDIAFDYNPVTGERTPVEIENDYDRFWWERDYMRVDWSRNNLLGYYWNMLDAYETFHYVHREPTPLLCDEGSDASICPASWRPTVAHAGRCADGGTSCPDYCPMECRRVMRVRPGEEAQALADVRACGMALGADAADIGLIEDRIGRTLAYADLAPWETLGCRHLDDFAADPASPAAELPYYLSFVTQEVWSPHIGIDGQYCDIAMGVPCNSFMIAVRHSFLRSGPNPDFEPINVKNSMWDRFGVIRMSQHTYARGSLPDEREGLSRDYGETDALNYWGAVHDIWANDLRVDADGRRLPYRDPDSFRPRPERSIRPIVYTLTKDFPPYLVESSMQAANDWNKVFMDMVRSVRGEALPSEGGAPYRCDIVHGGSTRNDSNDPHDIAQYTGTLDQFDPRVAYEHRFEGTECVLKLQVNPCNLPDNPYDANDDPMDPYDSDIGCAELGDIRHHFWAWIDVPGAFFSGVSLPLQDPRNGRLVSANVNVTQDSIERSVTTAMIELGLAAPGIPPGPWSREQIMSGEDRREYFENLGKVDYPVRLAPMGGVATEGAGAGLVDPRLMMSDQAREEAHAKLEAIKRRMDRTDGAERRAMVFSDRVYSLAGTQIERSMMDFSDVVGMYAEDRPGGAEVLPRSVRPTDEAVLDAVSPFRVGFGERLKHHREGWAKQFDARHCFFPTGGSHPFIDNSLVNVAEEFREHFGTPGRVEIELRRRQVKWVYLHEMGHSIGMEHNFAGSADTAQYHDEYYDIARALPFPAFPCPEGSNCDATAAEINRWYQDILAVQYERERVYGIDRFHWSTVMDYPPELYNLFNSLGKYDNAFTLFAYGRQAEVYRGDPGLPPWDDSTIDPTRCRDSAGVVGPCRRLRFTYYLGGEPCTEDTVDTDCPYAAGSPLLAPGQAELVAQTCAPHYRQRELPSGSPTLPRQCSNFDEDWARHLSSQGRPAAHVPVKYRNCGNSRVNDISWCNMFDEGASFREIVMNLREFYHRVYPLANFRRYRADWRGGAYWFIMDTIGKIYQHMFYRLFSERGYGAKRGGFGFEDQFLASADGMHLLAEMVTTPDVGSYVRDPITNSYVQVASGEYDQGDMDIRPGLGKYMWSAYENTGYGFYRKARQGVILDKIYALLALVLRDWGVSWGQDERYYINFYDLFPSEMVQLFGGLMLDNAYWYGPRMTGAEADPRLTYMPLWRGWCNAYGGGRSCAPDTRLSWDPSVPAVGGGSNVILRNFAGAYSLAEFPVFYNTMFEQQLYVALAGGAEYFDIPNCDIEAMTAAGETERDTCVIYTSPTFHKTYVAAKLLPRRDWETSVELNYESLAGALLREMNVLVDFIRTTTDEDARRRAELRLLGHEGFLQVLIDLMRRYGISSWF